MQAQLDKVAATAKSMPGWAWKLMASAAVLVLAWITAIPGIYIVGALVVAGVLAGMAWMFGKPVAESHSDAESTRKRAAILNYAAYFPEALSISLVIGWAYTAVDGQLIRWVFAAAFVAFVAFKIVSIPEAVAAFQRRDYGLFFSMGLLAFGSALVLLVASVFELVNTHSDAAQARIETSRPAEALDKQIENARREIEGLSKFADKSQADNEAESMAAAESTRQSSMAALRKQIADALADYPANEQGKRAGQSLNTLTAGCTNGSWYTRNRCAEVFEWRAELERLEGGAASGAGQYQTGYSAYTAKQKHLESLLQQRANLSATGQGVQSAYKAEDRLLARAIGTDAETAAWYKLFIWAVVFDTSGMWARFNAALLLLSVGGDSARAARRRFNKLLEAGLSPQEAAKVLAGASVAQPTPSPAYSLGQPEIAPPTTRPAYSFAPPKEAKPTDSPAYNNKTSLRDKLAGKAQPKAPGQPIATTTVYKDVAKVPPELSGRDGLGGKSYKARIGLKDDCRDCGAEYVVRSGNSTRCPECAAKAEASYQRRLGRAKA